MFFLILKIQVFFLLINSIKKKENKGNKVINKEILKSVASDIITTTLK